MFNRKFPLLPILPMFRHENHAMGLRVQVLRCLKRGGPAAWTKTGSWDGYKASLGKQIATDLEASGWTVNHDSADFVEAKMHAGVIKIDAAAPESAWRGVIEVARRGRIGKKKMHEALAIYEAMDTINGHPQYKIIVKSIAAASRVPNSLMLRELRSAAP